MSIFTGRITRAMQEDVAEHRAKKAARPDGDSAQSVATILDGCYQKYQHLDALLCDEEWLGASFQGRILCDLWAAVKAGVLHLQEAGDDL